MSFLLPKKRPVCERISQDGESTKYACETEPGKTFVVTIKPDGTITPEASFVMPNPDEYKKIFQALMEKGERVKPVV